jgi:hypothetical protein
MLVSFNSDVQCEALNRDWIDDAIDDEIDDYGDWEVTMDNEFGEFEY